MATPATESAVLTRRGVLAAAAGTLLPSACGPAGPQDQASAGSSAAAGGHELVGGASLELSGLGAALGVLRQRAMEITLDSLNVNGIPVGNLRRTIRLEVRDNGSDPRLAARQATELTRRDNVHALVGGTLAETSMAIVGVAQKLQVPFLSFAAGDDIVLPLAALARRDFTFRYLQRHGSFSGFAPYGSNALHCSPLPPGWPTASTGGGCARTCRPR
ncbi:ABC transporter substrate-binding protein [Micromonospora sp. NBC_00898]|uniref:ABC transporter substrate-binding protein n=1 Tax=Micromonospora sp. NBC_00898 TaxID=2975981 RepID=UPI0038682704|nr:ABC transporter substrate-binding protein [Micromonospora sp. NBC_00898]